MIRSLALPLLLVLTLAACASGPGALLDPALAQRRGAVEVAVKSAHPGILEEIDAGGGPALSRALDAAGVPPEDRPARLLQLKGDLGLYRANPGALVAALVLYGA
mgnify:CR=1 FL=1